MFVVHLSMLSKVRSGDYQSLKGDLERLVAGELTSIAQTTEGVELVKKDARFKNKVMVTIDFLKDSEFPLTSTSSIIELSKQ